MAANWNGMESALKSYFEKTDKPDTPASFTEVGNKIATEYKNAISSAKDHVGNSVLNASSTAAIGPAFAAEFAAQMGGAAPNFGPVIAAVTLANTGLVLGFTSFDSSVSMVSATVNIVSFGGSGNPNKYKVAFQMKDDMTAAKTAKRITDAMKAHFNSNTTLLTGATAAPSPVASPGSLS